MREPASRHRVDAQDLGGFDAAMADDDLLCIVDQDRITEPELLNAVGDLPDLPRGSPGHRYACYHQQRPRWRA